MSSRVLTLGALCTTLLVGSLCARPTMAAPDAPKISIELVKVPLARVVQLLASNGDVQILFQDPEGKLADLQIPYISIKDQPIERAIQLVCRAANVQYERDQDGIYFITPLPTGAPKVPAPRMAEPEVPLPQPMEEPEEVLLDKIVLRWLDPVECTRTLYTWHAKESLKNVDPKKTLDDYKIYPGLVDPQTKEWYLPNSALPGGPAPVIGPNALGGNNGGTAGNQLGIGGGLGGGGLGGGLGGGGLGGGLGGGGLGGGLGGGGLGGGLGGGGLGGGGLNLVPEGIQGVLGYPLDNSLLVQGTPDGIEQLKRIIRLLDIPPQQISIKIEQIAVTSTFEKSFGLDFDIQYNDIQVNSNIGLSSQGAINVALLGDNWRIRFAAAVAQGKASVVDSFVITTMNNVLAQITQLNQTTIFIPVVNQVQGAGLQTVFVPFPLSAQTQFTAIPRLNGDGTITMIIPLTFQRFIGESVGPNGERIPNLTSTSLLALRRVSSGQTIVIGGITNRNETNNSSGIPLLKDLPFVGSLFRSKRVAKTNTESLFFFTPTLLPDPVATGSGNVGNR